MRRATNQGVDLEELEEDSSKMQGGENRAKVCWLHGGKSKDHSVGKRGLRELVEVD